MTKHRFTLSRRSFVKGAGALAVAGMAPAVVRGQGAPMQLGVLTPLTGAGSAARSSWWSRTTRPIRSRPFAPRAS